MSKKDLLSIYISYTGPPVVFAFEKGTSLSSFLKGTANHFKIDECLTTKLVEIGRNAEALDPLKDYKSIVQEDPVLPNVGIRNQNLISKPKEINILSLKDQEFDKVYFLFELNQ